MRTHILKLFASLLLPAAAALLALPAAAGTVTQQAFGTTPDGKAVSLYTLTNRHGMQVKVMTYGATVTSLSAPDKAGRLGDVVLGFDNLATYEKNSPYFGAIVGRYANRIARGQFTLDGKRYQLAVNNPPNTLHGGTKGFDKVVWTATPAPHAHTASVVLRYVSADGEENFPGRLTTQVVYTLSDDNSLQIAYSAVTTKDTVVNLTFHGYFNLAGQGNGTVLDHTVMINADRCTPIDKTLIPTGQRTPVAGTALDFRTPHVIGARISTRDSQILNAGGYDHNFVLRPGRQPSQPIFAARVSCPRTGRVLTVYTDQPGLQFYTGNFLDGTLIGKAGKVYPKHGAFCLETQHFPDSPNKPRFPTTELKPGETFHSTTLYRFTVTR